MLDDPSRPVSVGGAVFAVEELFGEVAWAEYLEDLYVEKPARLLVYADLLGDRRTLWLMALSGASYGGSWFPNRPWRTAVRHLRELAEADESAVSHRPDGPFAGAHGSAGFWETLESAPERLNGAQAWWVITSRLTPLMWETQREFARKLGATDEDQFNPFMSVF